MKAAFVPSKFCWVSPVKVEPSVQTITTVIHLTILTGFITSKQYMCIKWGCVLTSLVTSPCPPPGEKRSGERSRVSWAYYPKAVKTNEIAWSVIITYNNKICHLHMSIRPFFEQVVRKMFWTLLGYNVANVCASPRNSTSFTRPFLLVRGWGLGTRLCTH